MWSTHPNTSLFKKWSPKHTQNSIFSSVWEPFVLVKLMCNTSLTHVILEFVTLIQYLTCWIMLFCDHSQQTVLQPHTQVPSGSVECIPAVNCVGTQIKNKQKNPHTLINFPGKNNTNAK